ncbi:MAG: alpha/beta hydrolase [Bacteroidota bacterium]
MEQKDDLHIYCISGLGADKRVFDFLELACQFTALDWIPHQPKENIASYAKRLIDFYELDKKPNCVIIGVSFGGMIAAEMCSLLKARKVFVISSATSSKELPKIFSLAGRLNLVQWIPKIFLKPNIHLAAFMFGTQRKKLLQSILNETDLDFLRWGMHAITTWNKPKNNIEIVTIHGTKDRIIPQKGTKNYSIQNGGHLMIIDEHIVISNIINEEIKKMY